MYWPLLGPDGLWDVTQHKLEALKNGIPQTGICAKTENGDRAAPSAPVTQNHMIHTTLQSNACKPANMILEYPTRSHLSLLRINISVRTDVSCLAQQVWKKIMKTLKRLISTIAKPRIGLPPGVGLFRISTSAMRTSATEPPLPIRSSGCHLWRDLL